MLKAKIIKDLCYFSLEAEFEVGSDQILVLWGPSGAGKTTILECLAGLRNPSRGTIELEDRLLYSSQAEINIPARQRQIGYLFQDYALFPHMTVEKNVVYGLECQKAKETPRVIIDYKRLLDSFGILHLLKRYPSQLSGGEKQRVALVRALVLRPRLLLLDEPFSSLDRDSKVKLRHELKNMHQSWKIPLVLVTHDEEDAAALGNVVVSVNQGRTTTSVKKNIPRSMTGE
jgi:molybdate transport system ATP-binding protein